MTFFIETPDRYRAALYVRLSKEDDHDGPSGSITNQLSLLKDFAVEHQLTVHDTYIDDGWSGTTFDRPAFRRMIADIDAGRVNMVITKDLSRLGRDYITVGHYMERYFPEKQVRYLSLLDSVDTGIESSSNDITPFRAILNDMYAKDISRKITSVKRDKQRRGEFIGGKPVFGYRMHPTKPNQIVIDEGAAPTVRRIFSMALDGMSCRSIAALLNSEGVPSPAVYANLRPGRRGPYAGLWSGERISELLQNETYLGNMVQGRTRKVSYKSKKSVRQARSDWIVVEGTHEPLVEREVFQTVQQLIASRSRTRRRTYDFLLKGLIVCRECGYPLAVLNRKNAAGKDVLYFVCRTYQRFTKAGICSSHIIQESAATGAVLNKVHSLCAPYLTSDRLRPIAKAAVEHHLQAGQHEAERRELQQNIESLTAKLDKTYLDRLNGILSEEDFLRFYQMLTSRRAELIARNDALSARTDVPVPPGQQAEDLAARFIESACTAREVLIRLIERVELTEEKQVIIHFRFQNPETPG